MIASLVPDAVFTNIPYTWVLWIIAVAGIGLLVVGADRAVSSAVRLAAVLGLSPVIIGATVVSLGTTTPETVVSVRAALGGDPELSLGNGVGSIICDTALIFGLGAVLTRLPLDRFILRRHGWLQFGAGALLTVVALLLWLVAGSIDRVVIPRWIGATFVALLVGYLYISVRWARQHPEIVLAEVPAGESGKPRDRAAVAGALVSLLILAAGLALVVLGSDLLIGSVREISLRYQVPKAVLAVTLVAFGTSVPELATAIVSIVKGHAELLVGNIIGADILNVLFVIGLSAAAVPLQVTPVFYQLLLPVMMLVLLMFRVFIHTSSRTFARWHGVPLLLVYAAFIVVLVTVFGGPQH